MVQSACKQKLINISTLTEKPSYLGAFDALNQRVEVRVANVNIDKTFLIIVNDVAVDGDVLLVQDDDFRSLPTTKQCNKFRHHSLLS